MHIRKNSYLYYEKIFTTMFIKIDFNFSDLISSNYIKYSIIIVLTIIIAFVLSKVLRMILQRNINKSTEKLKIDATSFKFIKNAVSFIIFLAAVIVIFYSVPELRSLGLTLFASAGIVAAIIGFASQQAFANIISGIFIVISKPFKVGDIIEIGQLHRGVVEDITLMHTVVRNFENKMVVIPNSVINSETILNSHLIETKVCNYIEFGISYDSDIDLAIKIIQDESMKHPNFIDNRSDIEIADNTPPVVVRLIGFGDSSVNLRAYVWSINQTSGFIMKCDLNKKIKEEFDKQGIEIPFPYRTVVYKKDLYENSK